ncbi:hypothetical protein BU17DRAFT_37295 [Hysterangium stoloniferum]|nr:hypothetical protein BU17DRAFT_37295 [Hysterangium stoloniferum]
MASSLPPAVAKLAIKVKPLFAKRLGGGHNLYQTLSLLPKDGVGSYVAQARWAAKGIPSCYWYVTRVKLKDGGLHGKAWGRLFWRGVVQFRLRGRRPVKEEELIKGGLKYGWVRVHPKKDHASDVNIPVKNISGTVADPVADPKKPA